MVTTILVFIIILGVLVFVHEFGHFIVARKTGMKVEEFGFGFPPRLVGIQKLHGKWRWVWGHKNPSQVSTTSSASAATPPSEGGEWGQSPPKKEEYHAQRGEVVNDTVYSINWIPFGGFVKIMGENNEGENDPRSFINRPFWARFATLVAGVSMNWILAAVLFSIIFMVGTVSQIDKSDPLFKNASVTNEQVAIPQVVPDSPAAKAGLKEGDIILKIDGQSLAESSEVKNYITENKGKVFSFEIKRGVETKTFQVQSNASPKEGEGPTGIAIVNIGILKLPFFSAIRLGIIKTASLTEAIFLGFGKLFTSKEVLKSVGGPIKIAQLTGEVYRLGFTSLLNFAGVLSVNLAVLNILPIPALDGGRVLFLIVEKFRGRRNNQKVEQWVNAGGFALLLALMLVVTVKDIFFK